MTERMITNDEELAIVFRELLSVMKTNAAEGKYVVFPPDTFVFPDGKIRRNVMLAKKAGEKTVNFSYGTGETASKIKALYQLGVTLYHLFAGESEHNRESYLIDGYRRKQLNSGLWPVIRLLLEGKESDIGKIEAMIDAVPRKYMVSDTSAGRPTESVLCDLINAGLKVLSHDRVAKFWSKAVPKDIKLRYSEAALREAAEANKRGENWILAYYTGQSLRQMRDSVGTDKDEQPCFKGGDTGWLRKKEENWAAKEIESGYYLLNFETQFNRVDWETQEEHIAALGSVYERAHEAVVAEAAFSNFYINEKRLLEYRYHWGREFDSSGNPVFIGHFSLEGMGVDSLPLNACHSRVGVVVARKFDF